MDITNINIFEKQFLYNYYKLSDQGKKFVYFERQLVCLKWRANVMDHNNYDIANY